MATPWERMPAESSKAYAAFCLYRDKGPRRSLDEASRAYHGQAADVEAAPDRRRRASGQIRRWAERWNWSARAMAWDLEMDRVKQTQQLQAVKEMSERHIGEAMLLQNKAVERLCLLRPEELKPREMLDYLIQAAKLERLARGEPTERVAEDHHFTAVEELSDDELARIIASGRGLPPPGRPGTAPAQDGAQQLL